MELEACFPVSMETKGWRMMNEFWAIKGADSIFPSDNAFRPDWSGSPAAGHDLPFSFLMVQDAWLGYSVVMACEVCFPCQMGSKETGNDLLLNQML